MIAADREGVTVAGDNPDRQIRPGHRESGGNRRGTAVNGVDTVGVQVVREPAGTSDAGDEHQVFSPQAQLGEETAHGREDDVVTASGAPAHLLIGGEVLDLLRPVRAGYAGDSGQAEIGADERGVDDGHRYPPVVR